MKSSDNKQFWDKFAKLYAPFMVLSSGLYQEISSNIYPHLKKNMNVLELACGSGQLSFNLSQRVHIWEATDFSPKMIVEAKKKKGTSGLRFSVQDATNLPYADETFDAVVISNALHIMPHPEKALREINRVLKKDGILFAPNFVMGDGLLFNIRMKLFEKVGMHLFHPWTEASYTAFIYKHDFEIITQKLIGQKSMPLCYIEARPEK